MNKALVLGATGGMGSAIINELVSRGIEVVAFARNKQKLDQLFGEKEQVQIFIGDAMSKQDLLQASIDVDVIFHAIGIPYQNWEKQHMRILENILEIAKERKAKFALVDNIYAYGSSPGKPITEEASKKAHTKKGKIRLQMENSIKQSAVPYLIVHFPDFYGPNTPNSLLGYTFQSMLENKTAYFVGNQQIEREFIYTPDGAKAMVTLTLDDHAYHKEWNIPGVGTITGKQIIQIAKEQIGYQKKVYTATKLMVRMLGLVDPMMREYVEMFYLNEEPVVLNGSKYQQEIGAIPQTSYQEGIAHTLKYMKK